MALIHAKDKPYPRLWALVGKRLAGKSTFLTAMSNKILVVDPEGRGREIEGINGATISFLDLVDRQDPFAISQELRGNAREISEAGIRLIAVDSLTPIFKRASAEAMAKNDRHINKNRSASFVDKANGIRLIQDAVVSLGTDVALIWHYETGRNAKSEIVTTQTISEMERQKLARSLNAIIELSVEDSQRVARVAWSRTRGHSLRDIKFVDERGFWQGVPEQIDQAIARKAQDAGAT